MSKDPYRRLAGVYDRLFQPMNAGLIRIGLNLCRPKPGMAVLDVGCGTGTQLQEYVQAGCAAYGIDLSPTMLGLARQRLGEQADLRLVGGDAMPFENDRFDLVTTTLTLHEMRPADRAGVLAEIDRVLKPDGCLLIIDFHPGPYTGRKGWQTKGIITLSEIAAGREHFRNYRQFMAAKGIPPLAADHGWAITRQKIVGGGCLGVYRTQRQ